MSSASADGPPPILRFGLAALALILAVLAATSYLDDDAERDRLAALAEERLSGSRRVEHTTRIERLGDPDRGRLLLARALIAQKLEPNHALDDDGSGDESDLEMVRRLAAEASSAIPVAWEAPMLDGAATYLEWAEARDDRLVLEADRWQRPLLASLELAPGQSEPNRFLAAAYLELWPLLAPERRSEALLAVRRALEDQRTFERLIEPWLERAGSRERAFRLLPDRPWAYAKLRALYAEEGDWRAWREAHREYLRALHAELDDDLKEAAERMRGGDPRAARRLYVQIAHRAPATREGHALLDRALLDSPPSVANRIYVAGLRQQLERALATSLFGPPPFEPAVMARLAQAAGELEPAVAAHAALVAGDPARARQIERRQRQDLWDATWSPYLIAKAEWLLARGDVAAAGEALDLVHATWQRRLPYWRAREHQARKSGDVALRSLAEDQLRRFEGERRAASDWVVEGNVSTLELSAAEPIERIDLEIVQAPPAGAVVEVRADGRIAAIEPVRSGGRLRLELPLAGEADHRLEVEPLTGGTVRPGAVRFHAAER